MEECSSDEWNCMVLNNGKSHSIDWFHSVGDNCQNVQEADKDQPEL